MYKGSAAYWYTDSHQPLTDAAEQQYYETETEKVNYVDQTIQQQQAQSQSDSEMESDEDTDYDVDQTVQQQQAIRTAHNGKVCSTWSNFHFMTFDGDIYYFPGTCNYILSSHCKSNYEDFNIQIRRSLVNNVVAISYITMKIGGVAIEIKNNSVLINGDPVLLPYSKSGTKIQKNNNYLKVTDKLGLLLMWNEDDSVLLKLDDKYMNQTCGLCGDYNGISIQNEFVSNNVRLSALQFGNLQKLDGPTEECEDPTPAPQENCADYEKICKTVLTSTAFQSCNARVGLSPYVEACIQDLCQCNTTGNTLCMCNTIAEYSRQCVQAGETSLTWRTSDFCPKHCTSKMQYKECGSPCANTCSNSERAQACEDHCMSGCFCPPGTVFDDINNAGCIPLQQCSCTYNGETYAPGAAYATSYQNSCAGGQWNCKNLPCTGTCSIEGGSHITTYDEHHYIFSGDCSYVLSKLCGANTFTLLGELRKCGLTDSETCLKSVALSLYDGATVIVIKPCGSVFVNWIYTQLPFSAANITAFRASSFFIIVQTSMGLQVQIQLVPIMQVYVSLDPSFQGQTCGLCGNFNSKQADDFKAISGVVEGTAASFANTWKTQADCPNVKNIFENPCTLSIENEKFAVHWCSLLTDTAGPFASCHSVVNPTTYQTNCIYDTCVCTKSEDCMCAALSSYARACAAKGVSLSGWRKNVCTKYTTTCPKSLTYSYSISSCQPTCRSLSEPDFTCNIKFVPVDGCTCEEGLYLNDDGTCVPATVCPCYYKGSAVASGEVIHESGMICTCTQGKLSCIGGQTSQPVCTSPMVYFDCTNTTQGTIGSECQKSCHTLDMECYSTQCISGCLCPEGLVSDGNGTCITEDRCPCIHNEATYEPGATIKDSCNTCTCKNRMWQCTNKPCLATCAVYGDGHYITFDGKRYNFNGDCEYTLAQDHYGTNTTNSTFRVVTENIPCGSTGTTCSKAIKIFLGYFKMMFTDEHFEIVERDSGLEVPYRIRRMGSYLVVEAKNGLIFMWDKKTSIFIKLSPEFQGKIYGLCGNYDGNAMNDFTTRSRSVVKDVTEFGNSWKFSPTCPDASQTKDPCTANPYRKSWAEKKCSIINSEVFAACHPQVNPGKYYEACVTDACACDTGGDCECFCTAVAAYAQACGEANICVSWRTPAICPVFCDYYNPDGECEWHYKPCGAPCLKTCRNPSGECVNELAGLEGCYPNCPSNMPLFDEDEMKCVDRCGCYDEEGNHYRQGSNVYTSENCMSCSCTMEGIKCNYDVTACHCEYEGKMYNYHDVIYNTTDGIGGCISAICGINGTIERSVSPCTTTPTTTFHFSSTSSTTSVETTSTTGSTPTTEKTAATTTEIPTKTIPNTTTATTATPVTTTTTMSTATKSTTTTTLPGTITTGTTTTTSTTGTTREKTSTPKITTSTHSTTTTMPSILITKTTPIIPAASSSTTSVITTTHAVTATTKTTTQVTIASKTPCFCHAYDRNFSPGDTIYNTTDASGCIFFAKCSEICEVKRLPGPCASTTSPASPTISPKTTPTIPTTQPRSPTTSSTVKTTSSIPGCPPKQINETWLIDNCTIATCRGNNVVTLKSVECPAVKLITCESGFPPVKVYSEDGCCFHYECECVCSGWGDPHYVTFDGTYYTFLDNCTYVLVKEITPRYNNFSVYIDNHFCDAEDGLSCPQSLIIYYKSTEIILTRVMFNGQMTNRIKYNKEWVIPGFTKNGITISATGIHMIVEIAEIQAYISFTGLIFLVKLPFNRFGYNTEGQCGTCTNNRADDCRLPDGTVVANCSQMAPKWKINVPEKPYCNVPPVLPPKSTPAPPPPCPAPAICDIIMSDIFAACHKVVPPKYYFEGCVFDACHMRNESIPCSSLELYASHCIANGICVNWRSKTLGKCPYSCPVGKIYKACGPRHPKTCDARSVQSTSETLTEGCFCPTGQMLFNSVTDVCVEKCVTSVIVNELS
ncbi:mucin-5AC-like [Rhinatrema bivittatum]|uniref:mucin-5AC-like n=1 Tax=Rhinatrema bivittatum TaxID=194408 RepID=UPI00112B4ADE|nr:mucin-5AC-like [Rhinatrema bivittatum]